MKSRTRRLALTVSVVTVALIAWLALARLDIPTVVDGYPIGAVAACADRCPRFKDVASAWLDTAAPGHSPVDRIELFVPNYRVVMNRSGGTDYIAVIHLADGSVRAIHGGLRRRY